MSARATKSAHPCRPSRLSLLAAHRRLAASRPLSHPGHRMRSRQPTEAAARLPCVSRAWTPCCADSADSAVSVAVADHRRLTHSPVPSHLGRHRCLGRRWITAGVGFLPVTAGHGCHGPRTVPPLPPWVSIGGCHTAPVPSHPGRRRCLGRHGRPCWRWLPPRDSRTWTARAADQCRPGRLGRPSAAAVTAPVPLSSWPPSRPWRRRLPDVMAAVPVPGAAWFTGAPSTATRPPWSCRTPMASRPPPGRRPGWPADGGNPAGRGDHGNPVAPPLVCGATWETGG